MQLRVYRNCTAAICALRKASDGMFVYYGEILSDFGIMIMRIYFEN